MKTIKIRAENIAMLAELNDSATAQKIWEALPIKGNANRWGDEIYFEIPVKTGSEPGAREEVEVGELGYWPVGHAFCIFFGPTPVSRGDQPRAYSPVNILGQVSGEANDFRDVKDGDPVYLDKVE